MKKLYIILSLKTKNNKFVGSAMMKANLLKYLPDYDIFFDDKIKIDKNSIYLFIKYIRIVSNFEYDKKVFSIWPKDDIKKLKENGNTLIFQPLDWNCLISTDNYIYFINFASKIFDHIIFNSKNHMDLFKIKKSSYIYHEYDSTLIPEKNEISDKVMYVGTELKYSFPNNFCKEKNIQIKSFPDVPCIHIDFVLSHHRYYKIHTTTKIATALNFNSIFVCNKIPIYIELLGDDYKFFLKNDLSNYDEIISKAKDTINNKKEYLNYLESMSSLKNILSPINIRGKYYELLKSFT